MAESTWADPKFQSWAKDAFILAKIDSKTNKEIRESFKVAGLPTVILAKPGGEEIDRTLGFVRTAEFVETIEGYKKGVGTLAALLAEAPAREKDSEFQYKLGERLFAHSRFADADARFARVVELDPQNASGNADDALMERAGISRREKKWEAAIDFCKEIERRWPASDLVPDAVITAAWFAENGGMKPQAIAAYKDYLARWPEGSDAEFAREQVAALEAPAEAETSPSK